MAKITPISGFPEFLPGAQIRLDGLREAIESAYRAHGYLPVETPVVERREHLLSKGISEKEVYGLHRLQEPEGGGQSRALALRFDLTVPLARYVAQHHGRLSFPFKRYQIQPVWRGERAQAGRYRQFTQCDVDVIGDGALSLEYDAEVLSIVYAVFRSLDIGKFTVRVNNRRILTGLFQSLGLADAQSIRAAISVVDDFEKMGPAYVTGKLRDMGLSTAHIDRLLAFFAHRGGREETFAFLHSQTCNETYEAGVDELERVMASTLESIEPTRQHNPYELAPLAQRDYESCFQVDLSIARGLDYYTGTVCETTLDGSADMGSVCSGGRYENLAGNFTNRALPGVGISIGLTRLFAALVERDMIDVGAATRVPVLVARRQGEPLYMARAVAALIRRDGVGCEVYLEDKPLSRQMRMADQRKFPIVVVCGEEDFTAGCVTVRAMATGQEKKVNFTQVGAFVRDLAPSRWL